MPRRLFVPIELPETKPDCCSFCPLIGVVPQESRDPKRRAMFACMATHKFLTTKGVNVSASKVKEGGHKHHRPCDHLWELWQKLPGRKFNVAEIDYTKCIMPYEQKYRTLQFN